MNSVYLYYVKTVSLPNRITSGWFTMIITGIHNHKESAILYFNVVAVFRKGQK